MIIFLCGSSRTRTRNTTKSLCIIELAEYFSMSSVKEQVKVIFASQMSLVICMGWEDDGGE